MPRWRGLRLVAADASTVRFGLRASHVKRAALGSGALERIVMLRAPDKQDPLAYECPRKPQRVRLIRNVAPNGEQRVLMTNLFDEKLYPASCFAELYHKRWGIERRSNGSSTDSIWNTSLD